MVLSLCDVLRYFYEVRYFMHTLLPNFPPSMISSHFVCILFCHKQVTPVGCLAAGYRDDVV